jgi:mRNA-degrading endonuclease toxin of MazEF toxin-antitoxin module
MVKRGDIFYADLGSGEGVVVKGKRPVIIIQNDIGNQYAPTVVVAAITSNLTRAKLPTHFAILSGESGLPVDSVILLDQIFTLDKNKLIKRIGTVNDAVLKKIDNALSISLGLNIVTVSLKIQELENYKLQLTKPLVITEGKTDVIIIETAWQKLYPKEQMFFECQSSGIEYEEDEREGNADYVRKKLEHLSNIISRPMIGLFDNDGEGNRRFKSLSEKIFEKYDIKKSIRKHLHSNVWGMLLPVPDERKHFVSNDDITQRYFVIEHYFSDEVLNRYSMYARNTPGTPPFIVKDRKSKFAKQIKELEPKEFEKFRLLLEKIKEIFSSIT